MSRRTLEFFISKKMSSLPELGNCSSIYYRLKNIAKPCSAGRNEYFWQNGAEVYKQELYTFSICTNQSMSSFIYNNDFSVVIFRQPCYTKNNNGWFLTKCKRRTLCQTFSKCISFTVGSTTHSRKSKAHFRRTLFRLLRWKAANTKASRI